MNLRDVEGRSALLLGKAKDNNASCSVGPFIRLFDDSFSLDDVRQTTVTPHGGRARTGSGSKARRRSRRSAAIRRIWWRRRSGRTTSTRTVCAFLGTMFAPTQDRGEPGQGFTHKHGDIVTIAAPEARARSSTA